MKIDLIDTTMRDGSQSLWALNMTTGMMETVAGTIDAAGFRFAELPMNPIYFKKFVRDHKEDPWVMLRLMARLMPRTPKACMIAAMIHPFELRPPRDVVRLFLERVVATGALNRAQIIANTMDQRTRDFPWFVPFLKGLGVSVAVALAFQVSPRHTDEYFAALTREVAAFAPDAIYLKDPGGLLTPERIRSLMPQLVVNAGSIPVELHSHCTTGLAPYNYLEAVRSGIRILHTALPPLANGSGQPSVFNIARNIERMGGTHGVDLGILAPASEKLTRIARHAGLPVGAPLEFDLAQFTHQVPGGVISNLRFQLAGIGIAHRLPEVLEEVVTVQRELGYPMMITPFSQFIVTQAAMHVASGRRYEVVSDEIIRLALGAFGKDSGYEHMEADVKDRILARTRASELAGEMRRAAEHEPSLKEVRAALGSAEQSDEDFLLRYIMKGDAEIAAMREAGPHRRYDDLAETDGLPLRALLADLLKRKRAASITIENGTDRIAVRG